MFCFLRGLIQMFHWPKFLKTLFYNILNGLLQKFLRDFILKSFSYSVRSFMADLIRNLSNDSFSKSSMDIIGNTSMISCKKSSSVSLEIPPAFLPGIFLRYSSRNAFRDFLEIFLGNSSGIFFEKLIVSFRFFSRD